MSHATYADRSWSDLEIERFIDGDLEPDQAAAIAAQIENDAALRRRVDQLRGADALVRLAMTTARPPSSDAALRPKRIVWAGLALAAVVLAAVGGTTLWMLRPAAETIPHRDTLVEIDPAPALDTFRIVLAVQVPAKAKGNEKSTAARTPTPEAKPDNAELREFQRALARGEAESARASFTRLNGEDRRVALDAVGRAVRSAGAAESVLDSLPATEQVALARAWAIDGTQRPVAFARLRSLISDADVGQTALVAVQELASRPELAGWIASYGLVVKPGT